MKGKLNKTVISLLKLVLSAAALIFVFSKIEPAEVFSIFGKSDILLMSLALVLFIISKWISAIRLNVFFSSAGLILSNRYNLKLYLLGMFYNLFLPGGIGGDGYKIWVLNRDHKVNARKLFFAVLLDRLTGMMALFCLAVLLSLFIHGNFEDSFKRYVWILFPCTIAGFYLVIRWFFPDFRKFFSKTSLQAFAVQGFQVLCAYSIFLAIGGRGREAEYLFLFLISSIVATLPFTIGGVGSREISFLYGAKFLGLDINLSIALSLAFYIITVFTSFFGIIYSIKGLGRDNYAIIPEKE